MSVRAYRPDDAGALGAIYDRAVREGARGHYDVRQRAAWAWYRPEGGWDARVAGLWTWLAEAEGAPVGFMSLRPDGHLEFAFVLPEWMGRGAAAALYDALEAQARGAGLRRLDTEASHLARRFLAKRGWRELRRLEKLYKGVVMTTFEMEKALLPIWKPM